MIEPAKKSPPDLYWELLKYLLRKTIQKYQSINKLEYIDIARIIHYGSSYEISPEVWSERKVENFEKVDLVDFIADRWVGKIAGFDGGYKIPDKIKILGTYNYLVKNSVEIKDIFKSFLYSNTFWKNYFISEIDKRARYETREVRSAKYKKVSCLFERTEYNDFLANHLDSYFFKRYRNYIANLEQFLTSNFLKNNEHGLDVRKYSIQVKLEGKYFTLKELSEFFDQNDDSLKKNYINSMLLKRIAIDFFQKEGNPEDQNIRWLSRDLNQNQLIPAFEKWALERLPEIDVFIVASNTEDISDTVLKISSILNGLKLEHDCISNIEKNMFFRMIESKTDLFLESRVYKTELNEHPFFSSEDVVTKNSKIRISIVDQWQLLCLQKVNEVSSFNTPITSKAILNIVTFLSHARKSHNELLNERSKSLVGMGIYNEVIPNKRGRKTSLNNEKMTIESVTNFALKHFGRYTLQSDRNICKEVIKLMYDFKLGDSLNDLKEIVLKWQIPLTNYYWENSGYNEHLKLSIIHPEDFLTKSILLELLSLDTNTKDTSKNIKNREKIKKAEDRCVSSTRLVLKKLIEDSNIEQISG